MALPDEQKTCPVSGHRIAYYRQGSGESVILVHGITTYSFMWRNIMPQMAQKYDVVAVDLLGCGNSDKPLEVSYSIKDHAIRLHEFVLNLGIKKVHFVGHDLGGGIGQIFAVRYPEMLYDLTVINCVAFNFWPVQPIIAMRTPIIRQFLMGSLDFGTLKMLVKRGIYYKERVTHELMEYYWKPLRTKEGRKAFLHFAKCLDNSNLMEIEEELRKLKLPVLIVRGDADAYLSASIVESLHEAIPGSKLVRFPDAGHYIQEDMPEKLSETIINFFEASYEEGR
jgi:pimeloyl-ACP methyl ester carboxylesterase